MGEFNVNKSDGSLEQTSGMPSEYPATQVMLSDGVTSVEDALDDVSPKISSGTTLSDLITAIGTIGQDNIDYIVINAYTVRKQVANTFVCVTAGESSLNFFILRTDLSTFKRLEHSWNSTSATLTDVTITSWSIHY